MAPYRITRDTRKISPLRQLQFVYRGSRRRTGTGIRRRPSQKKVPTSLKPYLPQVPRLPPAPSHPQSPSYRPPVPPSSPVGWQTSQQQSINPLILFGCAIWIQQIFHHFDQFSRRNNIQPTPPIENQREDDGNILALQPNAPGSMDEVATDGRPDDDEVAGPSPASQLHHLERTMEAMNIAEDRDRREP